MHAICFLKRAIICPAADEEEIKVGIIAEEVTKKQKDCEEDLVKAEPALLAAQEALNTLNKANLTELKSFGSPPGAVTNVTAAVMVLLAPAAKVPKDRSWKAAKVFQKSINKLNIPKDYLFILPNRLSWLKWTLFSTR